VCRSSIAQSNPHIQIQISSVADSTSCDQERTAAGSEESRPGARPLANGGRRTDVDRCLSTDDVGAQRGQLLDLESGQVLHMSNFKTRPARSQQSRTRYSRDVPGRPGPCLKLFPSTSKRYGYPLKLVYQPKLLATQSRN